MATATTTIIEEDEEFAPERAVRFHESCVLIPTCHKRTPRSYSGPRIVTKSISLPLWKRGAFGIGGPFGDAQKEGQASSSSRVESDLVTVKLPMPVLARRPSKSKSPVRSELSAQPLSPCLRRSSLRRTTSESSSSPSAYNSSQAQVSIKTPQASGSRLSRSPSLPGSRPPPLSPNLRARHHYEAQPDEETVPLRPCCPTCFHGAEMPLDPTHEEDVKFSKGAMRRRRSISVDTGTANHHGCHGSSSPAPLAIQVDEVDKKRSFEAHDVLEPEPVLESPKRVAVYAHAHFMDKEVSDNSSISSVDFPSQSHGQTDPLCRTGSDDAADENELFPLPSPKRTPTASPAPSPSSSAACVVLGDQYNGFDIKRDDTENNTTAKIPFDVINMSSTSPDATLVNSLELKLGLGRGGGARFMERNNYEAKQGAPAVSLDSPPSSPIAAKSRVRPPAGSSGFQTEGLIHAPAPAPVAIPTRIPLTRPLAVRTSNYSSSLSSDPSSPTTATSQTSPVTPASPSRSARSPSRRRPSFPSLSSSGLLRAGAGMLRGIALGGVGGGGGLSV